ncbi:5-oxoprolinase subunit PxpB [Labrys wisconsinensis]|uniref:KipI family sensor histidine kinase inhibitor n=1 Tax=Labrys wisconsinensis TaxID=425677 RepID=A0ABU0JJV9_9HYPH|nr:5-oxoprolinase subunit PxpB [Labrys wisconsinensis]MDQ0474581.1 KipI family sensor histidine kinase inhibitor [Labrys wisconsinensis]
MDGSGLAAPRFLDAGDGGLVAEFGDEIDAALNERVMALDAALAARGLPGVTETVPTYRSLLVLFDPLVLPREQLVREILALRPAPRGAGRSRSRWRVPVCYGGECGVDLEHVAGLHGLTPDEVVALHAGAEYRIYMIGFAPGFAYLGGLPERIHTSRRTDPRLKTPPRSISIGGRQAAVSPPLEIPSGWHLIGQTPVRSYDPGRESPFLFEVGDAIRFEPVDAAAYREMLAAAEAGEPVAVREDADG